MVVGSGVVVEPGKEVVYKLRSCLKNIRGVLVEALSDMGFRERYGGVVNRVLGVLCGSIDVGFIFVSGLLCARLENGVSMFIQQYT